MLKSTIMSHQEVWQLVTSWPGRNPPSISFVNPNQLSEEVKRELLNANHKDRIELISEETENLLEKVGIFLEGTEGIPTNYHVTKILSYYAA